MFFVASFLSILLVEIQISEWEERGGIPFLRFSPPHFSLAQISEWEERGGIPSPRFTPPHFCLA